MIRHSLEKRKELSCLCGPLCKRERAGQPSRAVAGCAACEYLERSAGRCPGQAIHEPENGCGPSVGGHSELGAECWRTAAPCGTEESQSAPTGQPAGEDAPSPRGQ